MPGSNAEHQAIERLLPEQRQRFLARAAWLDAVGAEVTQDPRQNAAKAFILVGDEKIQPLEVQ